MKVRAALVAVLVVLASIAGGVAYATTPPGEGGPGTDTSYHNKYLFTGGNPTQTRDKFCRGRMAGPYPSGATRVVAKFRVECREKNDLIFTTFVARLKNLDANYGATVATRRCFPANATRRIDASGVAWYGCTHSLTVTDRRPVLVQDWQSSLALAHEIAGPDASTSFSTVIAYCYNHRTYCNSHPAVLAMRYWVG